MIIERYGHAMHIVSSAAGKLAAGKTPYDLMPATFPVGPVSGAPKIRAMQIIADLEGTTRGPPRKASILDARRDSNPRGRYGGCVGYFSFESRSENSEGCCGEGFWL